MPNNTKRPSALKMFSDCPKISSEISAKGTVSGSDDMMVIGCSQLSNWAAMIKYMKTNESRIAMMNPLAALPNSLA